MINDAINDHFNAIRVRCLVRNGIADAEIIIHILDEKPIYEYINPYLIYTAILASANNGRVKIPDQVMLILEFTVLAFQDTFPEKVLEPNDQLPSAFLTVLL